MSNVEFAEEMQTYYFENENMVSTLNAKRMQKESQNINLIISHNFFVLMRIIFILTQFIKYLTLFF